MKTWSWRLLLPALLLMFCACRSSSNRPQFLGKWQDIANPTITLEIAGRGDKYLLNTHDTTGEHQYIASLDDHTVTVAGDDLSSRQISFRDNSVTLEWGGAAFKRAH